MLLFCFVLIYRLCQINRHQKRMTVLYRKQWSICLDGNLSLTGSWWKSSETIISHWCVDIALKTDIGFFWAQLLSEYKSTLSLRLRTNWLTCCFTEDGLLSVSLGPLSAAGFEVVCFGVSPSSLSSKSYRFSNLIVSIKCFRS